MVFLLLSCEPKTSDKVPEQQQFPIQESFLALFPDYSADSFHVAVEPYTLEKSFPDQDCIPLSCEFILKNKIYSTRSKSTGAKPLGKIKLSDNQYFLVLVQQDDYGPVYYGLTYYFPEDSLSGMDILAEHWSDAGDSQITHATVQQTPKGLNIHKEITTCHSDLDFSGEEVTASNERCQDSTSLVQIQIRPHPSGAKMH